MSKQRAERELDISEEIFRAILSSNEGDYHIRAQVLADMKPYGW